MRFSRTLDRVRGRCGSRCFYTLLVFVPSAAVLLFGAWVLARSARETALVHLQAEQTLAVQLGVRSFSGELSASLHGLNVLARQPSLQRALDEPSPANRAALARDAIAVAETLGIYDKVRWIDQTGQERMRIDWEGNRAVPVPDAQLQNKASRYFVRDTQGLPLGSVYVSPLDLNVDHGRLEVPYKPTLRYARPLLDGAGRRRGILLVNVLAQPMLEAFNALGLKLGDDLMLVNADGYWLSSSDPEDTFAFMFGRNRSLAQRYPEAWRLMHSQASGQQRLASGLWTWSSVRPYPAHVLTTPGSGSLAGPSPGGLRSANGRGWVALTRVQPQQLAAIEARATRPYTGIAALLLGALAGISALVGRALEERRLAVERLQVLAENAADVVFRAAADGALEWVSPSVQDLLGFPSASLRGRYGHELVVAEDLPRYEADLEQVRAGRKVDFEARFRTAAGGQRWLAVSIRPLLDGQGKLVGRVGHWRDIQEEVQAREARAKSEQRFQLAMESSAVGMALVAPEGTFLQVNPALCAFFGRDAANLQSCTWQALTHPDDLAADQALQRQVKDGLISSYRLRKRFLKADGQVVWGDLSVAAIRPEAGGVQQYIKQVVNVTQEVTSQQQLTAREAQYRLLAENASDVVLQADHEQVLQWVSPSAHELFGAASGALVGTRLNEWVHPDDVLRLELIQRRQQVASTGMRPDQGHVVRLLEPDGGYRWVAVRVRLLRDRGGAVTGQVLALRDVDDLVGIRQKLETDQQFVRATLDSLLDPHVTFEPLHDDAGLVQDFVFADANAAGCSYIGVDRSRLIGARVSALMPGVVETGLLERYKTILETGEPLVLNDFFYPNHETIGGDHYYDLRAVRAGKMITLTWRDVTGRVTEAERLARSEERYRLLAENATDLVLRLKDNQVIWISGTAGEILGAPPEYWIGNKGVEDLVPPEDLGHYVSDLGVLAKGATVTRRIQLITADGSRHWFSVHAKQFRNAQGEPDGISASLRNIDAEVAADAELDYRARYDQLTGLANRSEALRRIEAQIGQSDHRQGRTAVLFIDVDKFKLVNDSHGHAAGDAVLQTLAERLRECTRDGDLVARLGGDELLVSLPGIHSLQEAVAVAEKIRQAGSEPITAEGQAIHTSLSIGVVLAEPDESIDALIARADQAMYRAKQSGRNQVIPIEGS